MKGYNILNKFHFIVGWKSVQNTPEFIELHGGPCDGEIRMIEFDIDTMLIHQNSKKYKHLQKKEVLVYKREKKDSSKFLYEGKL